MKKNKIIIILLALVIVAGIIVALTAGFNLDMSTKEHSQIVVKLEKEYNISDIEEMTNEILKDQPVEIQKAGQFEEDIVISSDDITDEQKNDIVSIINEKYETEVDSADVEIVTIPRTRLSDMLTPYIWTFVIATILVVIYFAIRYKQLGIVKAIVLPIILILITEMLTLSIIAITRILIGSSLVSIVFVAYVMPVFACTTIFENKLQKLKAEKNKKQNTKNL